MTVIKTGEYSLFRTSSSNSSHSTTSDSSQDHGSSLITEQANLSPCDLSLDNEPCPTGASNSVLDCDSHAVIASGDFGEVVKLKTTIAYNLTDTDKYKFLTEHFIPTPNHPYPARTFMGTVRHFQHSWLTKYPGLVYSLAEGGFCNYCVLFANTDPSVKELGVLVTKPLHNFKKATEILNDHFY